MAQGTQGYKRHSQRWGGVLEALGRRQGFNDGAQAGLELAVILLPQSLHAGIPGVSHHAVLGILELFF